MLKYYKRKEKYDFEIKFCRNEYHAKTSHAHNEISLTYILKGKTILEYKGEKKIFKKGDCVIIPDGVFHSCSPKNYQDWEFILIYIKKDWFYSNFSLDEDKIYLRSLSEVEKSSFLEKYRKLISGKQEMMNLKSLLNTIFRKEFFKIGFSSENELRVKKIKEYIDSNYSKGIGLDEIGEFSGLSRFYLIKLYKRYMSVSPINYLNNLKINRAKDLLNKGEISLAEIALELGFYDQSHFSKIFKKYTGLSPKKYQESNLLQYKNDKTF